MWGISTIYQNIMVKSGPVKSHLPKYYGKKWGSYPNIMVKKRCLWGIGFSHFPKYYGKKGDNETIILYRH